VARFGGTMETQAGPGIVDHGLPGWAAPELREFWRTELRTEVPARFLARLPGGRMLGAGIVLAPDGTSVARDVSLDFGKSFDEHWLLNESRIPPPQPVPGTTAVIATALAKGYGHWLLDELPRLLSLPRDQAGHLIAHTKQPYSRTALAQYGWSGAILEADRRAHFQCEQLIVPSLSGTVVHPTQHGLDLITEFIAPFSQPTSAWGDRLYITREGARRRRVTNEPELWAGLQAAGFAKVRLEQLTWPEQINAFRHAKVVVGPHGAGLANLAFCLPGTRVVELFHRAYVAGGFWRLADLRGLDYRPVVSPGSEPLAHSPSGNRRDLTADLKKVRAALKN
jgi:capsular polysaccharide biosynthesis protein